MNKLLLVQAELKAPKNQRNNFGNYNYRSCEDILEAVKPLLKKYECQLTLSDELVNVGERYYVKATARFVDGDKETVSTAYARESETKKGMDDSQITGTASSYARKYALNGLFLIDDTKDADTDEHTKLQRSAEPQHTGNVYKQGVNFTEIKNKVATINDLDELENYYQSLKLTPGQTKIVIPFFADRKKEIAK